MPNFKSNFLIIISCFKTFHTYIVYKLACHIWYMILKNFGNYLNKLCHRINCSHKQPSHAQKSQKHHKCSKISRKKSQISLVVVRKETNKRSNYTVGKIFRKLVNRRKQVGISNSNFIHVKSHIDQLILAFFLFFD